ncbi:MAG: elongation factor G [Acutalibacteraceae bacterium]
MKEFNTDKIKNLALLGHGSCGKTSIAEAMLYVAGVTDRHGTVADGNTVMDFDEQEKKRKVSVFSSVASLEWRERKINLIDAPGLFDFANGQAEAIRAAKNAVIVLSAKSGLNVGSQKAYKACQKHGISTIFFITKADSEHANCKDVIASLKIAYGSKIMPVIIPYASDRKVECYINVVTGRTWKYENGKPIEIEMPDAAKDRYEQMYGLLCESVASLNEEMMDKYFSGEKFTEDELFAGLREGVKTGEISPVYCGAAQTLEGIELFLNALVKILPNAEQVGGELGLDANGEAVEVKCSKDGPLAATVFKTVADPFVGKMSYFKVISGVLKSGDTVLNPRTGETEKIGKLMYVNGGKQTDTDKIIAGDIGAVAKMADVKTGDTLCDPKNPVTLSGVNFPKASISMAVKPVKKGDEDKIAQAMAKICEENPSVEFVHNKETHQLIISGLGEQSLDVIVSMLKTKFGVDVTLETPKVAYRETIRKKVKVQGRHKKQSGGHGQFGDVWIEFEPCDSDTLVFEEKIFGGAVPKNYFPAVEKGLLDSVKKGVLAGYPVVGLKATLVDGSYHPVDSSEMAFKTAAAIAYKNGLTQANPVLLEPVGALNVTVPEENMGDIIGDINKRRGRVLGMNPLEDKEQEIVAEVPIAEASDFSTVLRSVTQDRGSFTLEFERYEEAPPAIAKKVIEEAKKEGRIE